VPPANDDFANATVLTGSGATVSGTTVGATAETYDETWGYTGIPTVWYQYHNATANEVDFSLSNVTSGAGFNPSGAVVYAFRMPSSPADFADVDANNWDSMYVVDPAAGDPHTSDALHLNPGQYLQLLVFDWDYAGETGTFTFDWSVSTSPTAPANDNFVDAIELTGSGGTVSGTNVNATLEDDINWYFYRNLTGSTRTLTLGNETHGAGFSIAAWMNYWKTPAACANATEAFHTYNDQLYFGGGHDRTVSVAPGEFVYIMVTDWNHVGESDTFTFDWTVDGTPPGTIYDDGVTQSDDLASVWNPANPTLGYGLVHLGKAQGS
jgi:hypothetical protein